MHFLAPVSSGVFGMFGMFGMFPRVCVSVCVCVCCVLLAGCLRVPMSYVSHLPRRWYPIDWCAIYHEGGISNPGQYHDGIR